MKSRQLIRFASVEASRKLRIRVCTQIQEPFLVGGFQCDSPFLLTPHPHCLPVLYYSVGWLCNTSLVAQMVKHLPAMRETWVWSLCWEDPLEEGMATHSSTLAWKIHGQRSLVGYSPWGRKESDTTERLYFFLWATVSSRYLLCKFPLILWETIGWQILKAAKKIV